MTATQYKPRTLFGNKNIIDVPLEIVSSESMKSQGKCELASLSDQEVVMFGSERQKEMGSMMDKLLGEITKGTSPVVFQLFSQLQKGIKDTNLGELQKQIEESNGKGAFSGFLDAVGLSSAAKRIQAASDKVSASLQAKSKSLLDLTNSMQGSIATEVAKMLEDSKKLNLLADEYRKNIEEIGASLNDGKRILKNAETELEILKNKAASNDPIDIEAYKKLEQRISLFENRVAVLENVYQSAPSELESLRLAIGASLSTISETCSSAVSEMSSIKSSLIKLAVVQQISSVQNLNTERRKLRDSLQNYGNEQLEKVAVSAAQAQGNNRLTDAQLLLDSTAKLSSISTKVLRESQNNKLKIEEARLKLQETRKLLA